MRGPQRIMTVPPEQPAGRHAYETPGGETRPPGAARRSNPAGDGRRPSSSRPSGTPSAVTPPGSASPAGPGRQGPDLPPSGWSPQPPRDAGGPGAGSWTATYDPRDAGRTENVSGAAQAPPPVPGGTPFPSVPLPSTGPAGGGGPDGELPRVGWIPNPLLRDVGEPPEPASAAGYDAGGGGWQPTEFFDAARTRPSRRAAAPPAPFDGHQRRLATLRGAVVNDLAELNWWQTKTWWQRRRSDPLHPHLLLFLFTEPSQGEADPGRLRIAARQFPEGDEPDLALLLYDLRPILAEHLREGRDPGKYIFHWQDDMSAAASYAGVAVSTLDTSEGLWKDVKRRVNNEMEVPGRFYVHLVDGTRMLVDRLARDRLFRCRVSTNAALLGHDRWHRTVDFYDPELGVSDPGSLDYRSAQDAPEADPRAGDFGAWQQLADLHEMLLRGGAR